MLFVHLLGSARANCPDVTKTMMVYISVNPNLSLRELRPVIHRNDPHVREWPKPFYDH